MGVAAAIIGSSILGIGASAVLSQSAPKIPKVEAPAVDPKPTAPAEAGRGLVDPLSKSRAQAVGSGLFNYGGINVKGSSGVSYAR